MCSTADSSNWIYSARALVGVRLYQGSRRTISALNIYCHLMLEARDDLLNYIRSRACLEIESFRLFYTFVLYVIGEKKVE